MQAATIRTMAEGEAEQVADLLVRANEENLATFPPDVALAYRAELVDMARRRLVADVYVAEVGGRVLGSVTYLPDASRDGHPWPARGAVLRLLAVDPAFRRQGLGERLTAVCIERALEDHVLYLGLHTAPTMAAARRIYERLGFVREPRHDFDPLVHYGDGAVGGTTWGLAYVRRFAADGGTP